MFAQVQVCWIEYECIWCMSADLLCVRGQKQKKQFDKQVTILKYFS